MGPESKCPSCGRTFPVHPGVRTYCSHGSGRPEDRQVVTSTKLDTPVPETLFESNRTHTRDDF